MRRFNVIKIGEGGVEPNGHFAIQRQGTVPLRLQDCPHCIITKGTEIRFCGEWCPKFEVQAAKKRVRLHCDDIEYRFENFIYHKVLSRGN